MTLAMCAGIAAHAEQLRQRALSLVLSLCKQRKNRYYPKNNTVQLLIFHFPKYTNFIEAKKAIPILPIETIIPVIVHF